MEGPVRKYRTAYHNQKNGAKERGIAWEFTFEQWLEWWGSDIEKRGPGKFDLQMQRDRDSGPYAPWNVRKGTPKQNSVTASAMKQNKRSAKAAAEHQARLDAMMWLPSSPPEDDWYYASEEETASKYGSRFQTNFQRTSQLVAIR